LPSGDDIHFVDDVLRYLFVFGKKKRNKQILPEFLFSSRASSLLIWAKEAGGCGICLIRGTNNSQKNTGAVQRVEAHRTWAETLCGICGCKGAKEQTERNGS
jgi:hypothetical protein